MAFSRDVRLCVIILFLIYVVLVVSNAKPTTPERYYVRVSSTAKLPCVPGNSGDTLRWYAEHADNTLQSRTRSYVDSNDPDLFINEIIKVQPSDAGSFVCSDGVEASSTELVVIEPVPVQNLEVVSVPDEIKVRWKAPADNKDLVRGYNIYATEVGQPGSKEVKIAVNDINPDGQEAYTLTDFIPGSTYKIQVAPLYINGVEGVREVAEGPRSPSVKIKTPEFEPVAWKVKAEPWVNSTILVTWLPPKQEGSKGVDGYTVHYKGIGKKDLPSQVTVTRPDASRGWSAVLKGLKTKNKYNVHVVPFTGGSQKIAGQKSQVVLVTLNGFIPELSVRALAVSPDTVLVTVDTVGGNKVDKLRVLYSDDSAIQWTRVDDYNSKEKYALVTGLQPRTRYFFNVKATVNKKARSVVTHVLTPPVGFSTPTNISVTAKTDSSILVAWNYDSNVPTKGFIVLTENLQSDGSVRPVKQNVVFKQNEAVVDGLDSGEKYQVKVEPFDLENIGTCSDPVLFQLNVVEETTSAEPERSPPQFVNQPPEELQINTGDEVKLTCTAIGTPHPVVQWYKDSSPHGKPADRVNEIVLSSVEETTLLTCTANNSVNLIVSRTKIVVTPEIEPQAPSFNGSLPETQLVRQWSDVQLQCSATGSPVPLVSWYKNNALVVSAAGSAEFVERRASGHFDLKCVASNDFGLIEAVTKVYIRELLRNPSISRHLPATVEKHEGEQLMIPCSFHGDPTPVVTWYHGDTRLGDPAPAQNTLTIDPVKSGAVLTCRGENLLGNADQIVQLKVIPKEPTRQSDYKVVLKEVKQSPTQVKVKWAVNEGNLNDIRYFNVKLLTETGRVVSNQRRTSNMRSETFSRLLPQTRYIVNVQTVTSQGVVDNSSVEFTPSTPDSSNRKPVLYFDIVEVRDSTVMVEFSAKNLNPQQVSRYRVRVKELDIGTIGNIILTHDSFRPDIPFILENLKPNRNYQVIIDVLSRPGPVLLTAIANFSTPAPGKYGTAVFTSSDTSAQPQLTTDVLTLRHTTIITRRAPPTAPQSTPATRRTPPTVPPRTLPTTASTEETTTEEPFVIVTTGKPVEEPENHDYVMVMKIPQKTKNSVDIRWTVDRGPLENIKHFQVTIKDERGHILLNQTLPENQRYITVSPLTPNTRYFVNTKAIGREGVLGESDVSFQTDPAEAVPDTSNPVLELEANELRAKSARLDWTAINTEPKLVASYKMRVLDSGPDGFNLATQLLNSESQSLTLGELEPNKRYHVILEALAEDDSVLMTSSLTFETPSENKYGVPVSTSSRAGLQKTPAIEKLSKSKVPQQASHPGIDDTSSDSVLEFKFNPVSSASHQLTWSTHNLPAGLVVGYIFKIRRNGPQGDVFFDQKLFLNETAYTVSGLVRDKYYFLELDALSQSGSAVLSASTLYIPGRNVTPVHATSRQSDSVSPLQSRQDGSQVDDDDGRKPEIELELNPFGHNQVKVNWTVINENSRRPIDSYKIKVHQDGPEGYKLHESQLNTNTVYYTVYDLLEKTRYYIQLDALDKVGRVIEYVGYPYLVPPPGYPVEPIRTSSVFNKKKVTTTVSPETFSKSTKQDRLPEREVIVISRVEAQGSNSMLVEWHHTQTDASRPLQATLVRYAEFTDNVLGKYKFETVLAGQQRLVIRHLKPDTTYGIQVAARGTGGYNVQWSKIVHRKTGPM